MCSLNLHGHMYDALLSMHSALVFSNDVTQRPVFVENGPCAWCALVLGVLRCICCQLDKACCASPLFCIRLPLTGGTCAVASAVGTPGFTDLYLGAMDAIWAMTPSAPIFVVEGAGQGAYAGLNWVRIPYTCSLGLHLQLTHTCQWSTAHVMAGGVQALLHLLLHIH